jgi:antitoxin VapB
MFDMDRGSVVMKTKTQAVRFATSVGLRDGVTSVDSQRRARCRAITPSEQSWAAWVDGEDASSDFMTDREQPGDEERAGL